MLRENQLRRLWNVSLFLKPLRNVLDTLKQITTVRIYMKSNLPILVISLYNSLFIELKKHNILI